VAEGTDPIRPIISPDGIVRIAAGRREISFFLEYDRGTENHDQLENKIDRYRLVGRTGRAEDARLFVSPSTNRERQAPGCALRRSTPRRQGCAPRRPPRPARTGMAAPIHDDRRRMILDVPVVQPEG
jgi:hypothetical protein